MVAFKSNERSSYDTNRDLGPFAAKPIYLRATYTMVGTEAASDTVDLFDLPANYMMIDLIVTSEDAGATLTVDVGIQGGTTDCFINNGDLAGATGAFVGMQGATGGIGERPATTSSVVLLTFATVTTPLTPKIYVVGTAVPVLGQ